MIKLQQIKGMKGLHIILTICFAQCVICTAIADYTVNSSRSTSKAIETKTRNIRDANSPMLRDTKNTISRKATNIKERTSTNKFTVPRTIVTRATKTGPTKTSTQRSIVNTNTIKTLQNTRGRSAKISRSATNTDSVLNLSRDEIMSRDFGKCKTVFYDCMDEFCANKNSQLKRCACSVKSSNFASQQKQLDSIEDKLLNFSQRLLTVSMDPEDAAIINTPTTGELEYSATKDTSASKRALDDIAKKLNTSFEKSRFDTTSTSLSFSLNAESAFDSVDSLSGTSTTAKNGTALYSAALPVCQEMAAEVCSEHDLALAQSGYSMLIEQDCNTVEKTYETQINQAQDKLRESGALLDMSRLNVYQNNNSDDILTCKSKMLDMLTNTSVCGDSLGKCLDITGQYINPTTGDVFLSANLINLSRVLTRPSNTETWSKLSANAPFVAYLNSKKKYLEPAMENCRDIADDVWDAFIEDALAQIKIAQESKLREIKQSCTSLVTDCISENTESLSDFDSRALSTFGILTDKTVQTLCYDVNNACNQLLADSGNDWATGMREIYGDKTYDTIVKTCTEVGQQCIIQTCKSIAGNFGLCTDATSVYRHAILNKTACWDEVRQCVENASTDIMDQIKSNLTAYNIYNETNKFKDYLYPNDSTSVYSRCTDLDFSCHLTESIWGHCNAETTAPESEIKIPENTTTLLSWFYKETTNQTCTVNICPTGQTAYTKPETGEVLCANSDDVLQCPGNMAPILCQTKITVSGDFTNCCPSGLIDSGGNCCENEIIELLLNDTETIKVCVPQGTTTASIIPDETDDTNSTIQICLGNQTDESCPNDNKLMIEKNGNNYFYSTTSTIEQYYINIDKTNTDDYCDAFYDTTNENRVVTNDPSTLHYVNFTQNTSNE